MAEQGGQVELEQSDMPLALNMGKMAQGGFLRAAIGEMQQLIKKPHAKVQEAKKWCIVFPDHNKLKAAKARHLAMVCENPPDGCFRC